MRQSWILLFLALPVLAFSKCSQPQEAQSQKETTVLNTVETLGDEEALTLLARIAIVARDYEMSRIFYGDILGFEEIYSGDISRPIVREQMQLPDEAIIHFSIYKKPEGDVARAGEKGAMIGLLKVDGVTLPEMTRSGNAPLSLGEPMLALVTRDIKTAEKKTAPWDCRYFSIPYPQMMTLKLRWFSGTRMACGYIC